MASKKKKTKRPKKAHVFEPPQLYADFIGDLLSGAITADRLYESRDARGNLVLEYDDPNG